MTTHWAFLSLGDEHIWGQDEEARLPGWSLEGWWFDKHPAGDVCSSTPSRLITPHTPHIAPRGAKKEEAFGGVILKSERPSGALFTNSGPPFFTVESKIEVLSPLGTSFHWLRTSLSHCSVQNRGPESARDLFSLTQDLTFLNYWHRNRGPEFTHAFFSFLFYIASCVSNNEW